MQNMLPIFLWGYFRITINFNKRFWAEKGRVTFRTAHSCVLLRQNSVFTAFSAYEGEKCFLSPCGFRLYSLLFFEDSLAKDMKWYSRRPQEEIVLDQGS